MTESDRTGRVGPFGRTGWLGRQVTAVITLLVLGTAGLAVVPSAAAAAAPSPMVTFDTQMVILVNQARTERGLAAVAAAPGLTSLSVWWSTQLASGRTRYELQHNPDAWDMLPDYGATSRTSWGENVAKFAPASVPARDIFDAYMKSPGHRANILGAGYRYVGVGTMSGPQGVFNTMTFTDKVDISAESVRPANGNSHGRLYARTPGGTVVPGVVYQIRPSSPYCIHATVTMKTAESGSFPLALSPGKYCAVPAAWPPGYGRPPTLRFTATAGGTFTLAARIPVLPVTGSLTAADTSGRGVANLTYDIRTGPCRTSVMQKRTSTGGRVALTLMPGTYCAVPLSAPPGYRKPFKTIFTVRTGSPFRVAVTVPRSG